MFPISREKGNYKVLKELNVEANVTYLTRLKNREPLAQANHDSHGGGHDDHGDGWRRPQRWSLFCFSS